MSRVTPQMRSFARRLIAYEARANKPSGIKTPAACLVSEKLRPHLATLMGKAGFHALLSRALALTHPHAAWLSAVRVNADGSLEGLDELDAQIDPDEIFEGCVVLLVQLLELLVAFIGESLALQLVREVWPKVAVYDLDFNEGDKK